MSKPSLFLFFIKNSFKNKKSLFKNSLKLKKKYEKEL